MAKTKQKYYVVRIGRQTGIFTTWPECQKQVIGYPGAIYKSFASADEANQFLQGKTQIDVTPSDRAKNAKEEPVSEVGGSYTEAPALTVTGSYAFVDGSYNAATSVYGCGGFLVTQDGVEYPIQESGNDPEMASMHNVAGEILGASCAIRLAQELGLSELTIYYDYQGIESWAAGDWKRNKKGTAAYHELAVHTPVKLHFQKVKGHSGIEGNERADQMAKAAAGIKTCK